VVVSHSRTVGLAIDEAFALLEERNLAFDRNGRRGIVVTGEDAEGSGHLEYLSIAPSRAEALQLEAEFEDALGPEPSRADSGVGHLARILAHMPQVRRTDSAQATRDAQRQGAAQKP
jgi:hypothetical protein